MTDTFPRPGESMTAARLAAFSGGPRVSSPFDHERFIAQDVQISLHDLPAGSKSLIDSIVDRLATPPDGTGSGYCLIRGLAAFMSADGARKFSSELFAQVWDEYRARNLRISEGRDYYTIETLSDDGKISVEQYGSRWSFKAPHADRSGVLFAHVYGPNAGHSGGEAMLIDAIAYTNGCGLTFEETMILSDDSGPQKLMLRAEHVEAALSGYGRRFGQLDTDAILLVNNGPEGLLHGATELQVSDETVFRRPLHRIVVRERDSQAVQ